jgi:heat shock protein HtpX
VHPNEAQKEVEMSHIEQQHIQRHRFKNILHTGLLLTSMGALLGLIGFLMFGATGLVWGLIFWVLSSLWMPRISPKMQLRWMGAQPVREWEAPQLYQVVDKLARKADLKRLPTLYWLGSNQPNAFAMGTKEEPYLGVTQGLLNQLNERQLQAVLAHEIGHIQNGDLHVLGLAESMSRLTSVLSTFGLLGMFLTAPFFLAMGQPFPLALVLLLLVGPTAMRLMLYALSRTREFEADRAAALLTNDPQGLASALQALERTPRTWWERIFMQPQQWQEPALLRTHPPTEERVERLLGTTQQTQRTHRNQARRPRPQRVEVEIIPPDTWHRRPQRRRKRVVVEAWDHPFHIHRRRRTF